MKLAPNCPINLEALLRTRALIVAGSGGGKSYALRKLIEETADSVQQLVIDPEGEFSSLRERHDFILVAAQDGDITASPKTAGVLAHRLLELGTSAILDLYELPAHERQTFVKHFLNALTNAPKSIYRPCMIVLDEAHVFCPQNGSAEAMQSVIDVATRGRKRGQCLVLATQRLSKLHKDTAAEMQNKLIGLTNLDVDRKRAAEELGMTAKEAVQALRLPNGDFYAFGPAFTSDVTKIHVSTVKTSHHSGTGSMAKAPPAPSATVKKQLAKLVDLDAAAQREAKTIEELKAENARLKREAKAPAVDKDALKEAWDSGFLGGQVEAEKQYKPRFEELQTMVRVAYQNARATTDKLAVMPGFPLAVVPVPPAPTGKMIAAVKFDKPVTLGPHDVVKTKTTLRANGAHTVEAEVVQLRSGAVRILRELAARYPAGYSKPQAGALTRFAHKGGTFLTYLSDLRRAGFLDERDGLLFASEAGRLQFGDDLPKATTHEEAMSQWDKALRSGAFKMLEAVVDAGEEGLHRANLADKVNMTAAGGTFNTYLSDLRRNGLIEEHGKRIVANDILFPEKP